MIKSNIKEGPCRYSLKFNLKMKLTTILLIVSLFKIHANSYSQNTKISLDLESVSIKETISAIEKETEFNFFYKKGAVDLDRIISIKAKKEKVFSILNRLFADTNTFYEVLGKQIMLKQRPVTTNKSYLIKKKELTRIPQGVKISGKISDKKGGPLPGANILEKGTTNGTQSNFDGDFSIIVSDKNAILTISYLGFTTQEISLDRRTFVSVVLEENAANLDEVVIVGYGIQKKINVTGAVSSIKADDVVQIPVTNVKGLLIGQIPGILTNQTPGLPGSDNVDLSIRGFGSPLFIVDGIESFIDRIDPNDVESITVLKDASAAIYGARAGDGVILVTTKRGKQGKIQLNYHGYTGLQNPTKFPEAANAAQFIKAKRNGAFNKQFNPENPNDDISYGSFTKELLKDYESGKLPSYNWAEDLLRNGGGQITSHNFNARGGSEKVRFFTSLGFMNQNSIFNGDYNYKKLTITNNIDFDLTDDLELALSSSYIDETRDYAASNLSDVWNDLRTAEPFYPTSLPDPNLVPYSGFAARSPIARTQKRFAGYNLTTLETLAAALELKYKTPFLPGLTIGAKANVRFRRVYNERLNRPYNVWEYIPEADDYLLQGNININNFSKSYTSGSSDPLRRILSRFYLNYKSDFGKHSLGALAFVEKEDNEINSLFAIRRELLSSDIPLIRAGDDGLTTTGGTGRAIEYTRVSVAGRINYAYDNRYLFEATIRADATSKHSPQVRWGYFPSVSMGWNIANESFMENSPFNQLKLRLSYSETGKDDNIDNSSFDYLTGFQETGGVYYFGGGSPTSSIRTTGLVNPFLTWEEVTSYNAGLDFGLLKNKIYGNIDVFYRLREGLIGRATESLPSTFGANLPLININSRNDHGFEILLGYRGSIGNDFDMDIAGTFSLARERFGDIQQDIDLEDPNQVRINLLKGRYTNRTFGYISDGLFNTQQEVDDYLADHTIETLNGTPKVGDIKYADVNGPDGSPDGVLNRFDVREIGYGQNPDMSFSLSTRFTYKKNLSLSLLWQGASLFNVRVSGLYRAPFDNEAIPYTLHDTYGWTQNPSNPGVVSNPNAQLPAFNNDGGRLWNNNFSDFWQRNGTYVRLKAATLAYKLPKSILEKISFSNIEFYITGDNLFAFTKLGIFDDAIDPEQAFNNGGYSLPLLKTYTFGVRLGL
ncbi:MAG: TonB-dependent receptor [Cellulophaga sp.]